MGYYILAWFVGLLTGAGGVGWLWYRYNAKIQAWAAKIGVTLPQ